MDTSKYILVTGGAGFIGSHTVVELIENGYIPVIVDDFRNSEESSVKGIEKITGTSISVRNTDVCDFSKLEKVFREFNFTGIIHFAAYKAVGESVQKPLNYYQNNLVGLLNVLQLATKYKVKNLVFSSSCTVYGEPKNTKVVTEESAIQPANSPYGNTKQIGEEIINDLVASGADIKILNLRYFNPVGAHSSALIGELPIGKPNNLIPAVTQTAIGKLEKITIFGNDYDTIDGTCVRDYIHVVDVANAHVSGIKWLEQQENSLVENINIGTGKGTSVLEIIHTFEEVSGEKLNWEFGPRREGDVVEIFADVSKSKRILNWEAKKTVKESVKDAWNWEKKELKH
ncbi:MAG TPA: UDP-glucose 4-epimerase GalE [Crocinitomicaceae bacterium]|nr:UDP-glucose 4-epimerase GalE [Crocinitomicaceae bacterium]